MLHHLSRPVPRALLLVAAACACGLAEAQTAPSTPPSQPAPPAQSAPSSAAGLTLDALAWLHGCWLGAANRREFREQWSPVRGGMMVGFSHTVVTPREGTIKERMDTKGEGIDPAKEKTQDFEYLRMEQRADGVYYVVVPSGTKELTFRLSGVSDESGGKAFTFTNVVDEFPQRIVYRRGTEGWLYAQVTASKGGNDVVYPMHHIDCATNAQLKE